MKLEIIKEQKFNESPWFVFEADGQHIIGSFTLSKVEAIYDLCKKDPELFFKETKEILKSEEIELSLKD